MMPAIIRINSRNENTTPIAMTASRLRTSSVEVCGSMVGVTAVTVLDASAATNI